MQQGKAALTILALFLFWSPEQGISELIEADCQDGLDYILKCSSGAVVLFTDFQCTKHEDCMQSFKQVDAKLNSTLGVSICLKTEKPPVFAYANVKKIPELAKKYGIMEVPTIRFFGSSPTREYDDYDGVCTDSCGLTNWVESQIRYFCLNTPPPAIEDPLVVQEVKGTPIVSTLMGGDGYGYTQAIVEK